MGLGDIRGFLGEDTDYGLRCEGLDVWMQTSPRVRVQHTFGRRFGIREVMKLHRGYALGQGALCGKLKLWGHRLAEVWDGTVTVSDRVRALRPSQQVADGCCETGPPVGPLSSWAASLEDVGGGTAVEPGELSWVEPGAVTVAEACGSVPLSSREP